MFDDMQYMENSVESQYEQLVNTMRYVVQYVSTKHNDTQHFDSCVANHAEHCQQMRNRKRQRQEGKHNPVPWWSRECQQAVNLRQAVLRRYKRVSSMVFVEYKRC